jgi:hypothetical protein
LARPGRYRDMRDTAHTGGETQYALLPAPAFADLLQRLLGGG